MSPATNLPFFALLLAFPALVEAQFTYATNNGSITITGYSGTNGTVTIPAKVGGLPVTSIGAYAFYYCWTLTNLTIGPNVTNLGYEAFSSCVWMTSVTFPSSLTTIGDAAFLYCESLTNVTIGPRVASIGNYAFDTCWNLVTVTVPGSVTNVGQGAFYGCVRLTNVDFQGNAPTAGSEVFSQDTNAIAYDQPGTRGWGAVFAGIPVVSSRGALQVNLTPPAAVRAGAQWRVNGGAYQASGALLTNLPATNVVVSFKPVSGWTTPASQTVAIVAGQTSPVFANYLAGNPPTLSHLNLNPGQPVSNSVYHLTGQAGDNTGVAGVWYQLNNGGWRAAGTANHWANWYANLSPVAGSNTLLTCAVGAAGQGPIYVADTENNVIRKILPGGVVTSLAGSTNAVSGYADGPAGRALFDTPTGVTTDPAGNVYVADTGNNLIRKISPTGLVTTLAGDTNDLIAGDYNGGYADGAGGNAQFYSPTSLAVDEAGNVYVADAYNNVIRQITPAGVVTTLAGSTNAGYADGPASTARFNSPYGLVLDRAGNLYVADSGNDLIRKITPDGFVSTLAGDTFDIIHHPYRANNGAGFTDGTGSAARFYEPLGLAADVFDNLYVADFVNQAVREISPAGQVITLTNAPGQAGLVGQPAAVAVDASGNVYVADGSSGEIQELSPAGAATVLAGVRNPGYANGTGSAAIFNQPQGITVDDTGASFSATNSITFDYVPSATLQVQVVGPGTVSPNYNNVLLALGGHYSLTATAKPGSGFVFTNWTRWIPTASAVTTNTATLQFTMVSNLVITATFVDVQKPVDTVTQPADNQSVNSAVYTVAGRTSDNAGVAGVWYQLNNGAWTPARTTNNWTNWFASVPLVPGTNVLRSYAVDTRNQPSVLVADTINNLIRQVSPDGSVTTLAGDTYDLTNSGSYYFSGNAGYADGLGGAASFDYPYGPAVDSAGNIYVADSRNNLIRKITPPGVVSTFAGDTYDLTNDFDNAGYADGFGAAAQFDNPSGIAVDQAGNVYVADTQNNLIRKITPDGQATTLAGDTFDLTNGGYNVAHNYGYADGPGGAAQFFQPTALAVDGAGNVFVADTGNNLIRQISPAGLVTTLAGDTYDLTNNGYYSPNDGYADGPPGTAMFSRPSGIAVDAAGNVYVADSVNNLIREITPDGSVSTLAGDFFDLTNNNNYLPNPGFADGTGTAAQFNDPQGLTVDVLGNVYVADTGNNLIRKITPGGAVSTYAGDTNAPVVAYADGPAGLAGFNSPAGVAASASDGGGNYSATNTVTFNYTPLVPLYVQAIGLGTITPDYSNALLAVGSRYTMTARPAPGFTFVNWQEYDPVLDSITPYVVVTNQPTLVFTMSAGAAYLANFADVTPPTLHIISPKTNQLVNGNSLLITGTASDGAAVASVQYQFDGTGWQTATGTNNWSAMVTPIPGANILQAYAVDTSGNASDPITVNFLDVAKSVLTVTTAGQGAATPNYNGDSLQVGENYVMTAMPAPGFAFANWSVLNMTTRLMPELQNNGPAKNVLVTNFFAGDVVTNSRTLMFTMAYPTVFSVTPLYHIFTNVGYQAAFVDIAPPTVTITAPTANLRISNDVYTVTGTARDNVGVAGVYYQLNDTGWLSASTGNGWTNWFTPSLNLLASATNTIQAYAVDNSGNVSATNTVRFVNLQVDPAPVSLAGMVASLSWTQPAGWSGNGFVAYGFATLGFGTNTFDQPPTIPGTPFSVGDYEYIKYSPHEARLIYSNTAPFSAVGDAVVLEMTFTSPDACTYSNETSGVSGTISFAPATYLAPATVSGTTALLIPTNGLAATAVFGNGTVTLTNAAGLIGSAACTYQPAGVNAGLLTFTGADQTTNYVFFRYDNTNAGLYYASSYAADGSLPTNVFGEFVFPTVHPVAPASLAGLGARVVFADGTSQEIGFAGGTYSLSAFGDGPIDYSMGAYTYARTTGSDVLVTLTPAFPPGTNQTFNWTLVAPDFCLFTNAGDPEGTVDLAAFNPVSRLVPASLGSATLYATNTALSPLLGGPTDVIVCHGNTFTQTESSGPYAGTSHGTFTYAAYGSSLALLTLKYTSPASLVGATNYLEASFMFNNSTNGAINGIFYDQAGVQPAISQGQFSIH